MTAIGPNPRILFLSRDPALVARQLAGERLTLAQCRPLRDEVSTDEITPTPILLTYDHRLGHHAHTGFETGGVRPIGPGALRAAGIQVLVAGRRYGKGSSRESSPLAELHAGIRLVLAESFERIYRQNCDNIGLATHTDLALLDRLDDLPPELFLEGRDPLTQEVLRAGGLLRLKPTSGTPPPVLPQPGPRTLAQKIIDRHTATPTAPGDGTLLRADWRFSHDYFTGMVAHIMEGAFGRPAPLHRPDGIILFQDHMVLAPESAAHQGQLEAVAALHAEHRRVAAEYPVRHHSQLPGERGAEGICHAILAERYVLPGQVVVGTDSHTPHAGALGALGFGAGATDIAASWVHGTVRCTVPHTVRVELEGHLPPGATARDAAMALLALPAIRRGDHLGAVFEFAGPVVRALPVDDRATLCNVVAELGGFSGLVEPDEATCTWIEAHRGTRPTLEPWMRSDPGAPYAATLVLDCTTLAPMAAAPGDPGQASPIHTLPHTRIDRAFVGSCTAAKRTDFDAVATALAWAEAAGLHLAIPLTLQFASLAVRDHCDAAGHTALFTRMGAELVPPGCGACNNCGPGQTTRSDEVAVSAINRNFPGRSGPGLTWLASPESVIATAIAGHLTSLEQLQRSFSPCARGPGRGPGRGEPPAQPTAD